MTRAIDDTELRRIAHQALADVTERPRPKPRPFTGVTRPPLRLGGLRGATAVAVSVAVIATGLSAARHLRGGADIAQSGEARKPALEIYTDATTALGHARSYHLVLTAQSNDGPVRVDLSVDAAGSLAETATVGGVTHAYVVIGDTLYVHDRSVVAPSLAPLVGDRWIALSAPGEGTLLRAYVAPPHVATCLLGDHGTLTVSGETTAHGVPALRLASSTSASGNPGYNVDVALSGTPYPLHFEQAVSASPSTSAMSSDCTAPATTGTGAFTLGAGTSIDLDSFDGVSVITAPPDAVNLPGGGS